MWSLFERGNLVLFYYLNASEVWPDKRVRMKICGILHDFRIFIIGKG
jgi:S-adenosylmethionine:diacylglycerol 3-amino-3-carboxypropyl transferase